MILFPLRQALSLRGTAYIPPSLSVFQATTRHLSFEEDVRTYVSAGIDGIRLSWAKMTSYGARNARGVLRSYGIPAISLVGVPSLIVSDSARKDKTTSTICIALDQCAELRIPVMGLTVAGGFAQEADRVGFNVEATLSKLTQEAKFRDVILALDLAPELTNDYIGQFSSAVMLVDRVADHNLKLILDVNYIRQESDLHSLADLATDRTALVRFSNCHDPTTSYQNGFAPDSGLLKLKDIFRRIHDSRYNGFYEFLGSSNILRSFARDDLLTQCRTFFDNLWVDVV